MNFNEVCFLVKKKKKKSVVPLRINLLFITIFILFSILIVQLGIVQILEGERLQAEIDKTINDISKSPVPRGKIYDSKYRLVVDNEPMYAITYTPPKRVQPKDKLDLAKKLEPFMGVDPALLKRITERNKKEYFYLENQMEVADRVSTEEQEALREEDSDKYTANLYNLELSRITEEEISNFTEVELNIMAIKRN